MLHFGVVVTLDETVFVRLYKPWNTSVQDICDITLATWFTISVLTSVCYFHINGFVTKCYKNILILIISIENINWNTKALEQRFYSAWVDSSSTAEHVRFNNKTIVNFQTDYNISQEGLWPEAPTIVSATPTKTVVLRGFSKVCWSSYSVVFEMLLLTPYLLRTFL